MGNEDSKWRMLLDLRNLRAWLLLVGLLFYGGWVVAFSFVQILEYELRAYPVLIQGFSTYEFEFRGLQHRLANGVFSQEQYHHEVRSLNDLLIPKPQPTGSGHSRTYQEEIEKRHFLEEAVRRNRLARPLVLASVLALITAFTLLAFSFNRIRLYSLKNDRYHVAVNRAGLLLFIAVLIAIPSILIQQYLSARSSEYTKLLLLSEYHLGVTKEIEVLWARYDSIEVDWEAYFREMEEFLQVVSAESDRLSGKDQDGQTAPTSPPIIDPAIFFAIFAFSYALVGLFLVVHTPFWIVAALILRSLHRKGYDWCNHLDAMHLTVKVPFAIRALPPQEEIATLPIYEENTSAIVNYLRLRKHR